MMCKLFKNTILLILLLIPSLAGAQQVAARVAGLENNPEYMSLLVQEKRLQLREDSVVNVVNTTRQNFRNDPDGREKYGAEILRLEQELFDIRNERGILTGKINAIEQEWVIRNLNRPVGTATPQPAKPADSLTLKRSSSPFLVNNPYFREHLSPTDYASLVSAQSREQSVLNYLQIFRNNYYTIRQLEKEYRTVMEARPADSIYRKYITLSRLNGAVADSISSIWGYIYDNKTYLYSYLLDTMNEADLLSRFGGQQQSVRSKEAEDRGRYMADVAGFYPQRKKLVLDFEQQLAGLLKLDAAKDSLGKALTVIDSLDFDFPAVNLTERLFLDYEDVGIGSTARYNAQHPIPPCEIYPRGTIYRIQIGSYLKPQAPSAFRGAYPLFVLKGEDGRYRYYAGGYRTENEAQAGVATMKRAGFLRPEIVVWEDGISRTPGQSEQLSAKQEAGSAETIYRIEIRGAGEDLSDAVKTEIGTVAEGKELARVASPEGGFVFIIGSFDSHAAAEKVVTALRAQDAALTMKIVTITL